MMTDNICKFGGRDWYYSFRELDQITDNNKSKKVISDILTKYVLLAKDWNTKTNSEWTCRTYFATNLILNATMLLKSAEYAEERNLRIVKPYLEYYAVFSLLRCVALTLPHKQWGNGEIISASHKQARNEACQWIAKFCPKKANNIEMLCYRLKAQRELISYHAPASGDRNLDNDIDVISICTLLAEIAQLNSELLEEALNRQAKPETFIVNKSDIDKIVSVELEGESFVDFEDAYRLDYISRKMSRPHNLMCFMTEGQTEDFIGAWDSYEDDDENDELYSSGSPMDWNVIFDIP